MVLGDGHEYERTTSLHLASRSRGGQFCIAPLLGVHGLRSRQGRGAEPSLLARLCEICSSNFRRALPALIQFAGPADARIFERFEWFALFIWLSKGDLPWDF